MNCQTIKLFENSNAELNAYLLDDEEFARKDRLRPAVIICPGGGYAFVSKNEGEPVAMFFARHGFQTFVLNYSISIKNPFPTALCELAKAVSIVRQNQKQWKISTVSVVGFSAGGNLALSLGIYFNKPLLTTGTNLTVNQIKPDRIILGYPAVTLRAKAEKIPPEVLKMMEDGLMPDFRGPSICEILAGRVGISQKEKDDMNLLKYLHKDIPPVFVWGTYEDTIIPVSDLCDLAKGLSELNVPCELHLFNHGGHGLSLADQTVKDIDEIKNTSASIWTELCIKWLNQLGNEI